MGGRCDNKHGVGIMLNKKWRQRIVDTEYINERAITTTIVVNRQRMKLMRVCFSHSVYADHHIKKMFKTIEKHTANCKKYIPIVGGDFNAELGPSHGIECTSVGKYTVNEGNKRGDWMKHWLMLQDYTALNTMYRKTNQKQTTFICPEGNEKQINYILTKSRYLRRYLRYNKDANDIIHMGSDHRCVMATFAITMPGRNKHYKNIEGKHDMIKRERSDHTGKNIEVQKKIPRDHRNNNNNIKKTPPQKKASASRK